MEIVVLSVPLFGRPSFVQHGARSMRTTARTSGVPPRHAARHYTEALSAFALMPLPTVRRQYRPPAGRCCHSVK